MVDSYRSKGTRLLSGHNLLQIAMPMGGIGTGCISLNGYGGLQDFSIHHAPVLSSVPDRHMPQDAGYALLHLPQFHKTRLLEGKFPPEKIYNLGLKSQGYVGGGFEGLPRYQNCEFSGEYPFGVVTLSDPDMPVDVTLRAYNPFIPLDDINSGIPTVILEYRLTNSAIEQVEYQFSYHLSHLAQRGAEILTRSKPLPGIGVYYWNEAAPESPAFGSAALGVLQGNPLIKARWFRGGWFDAGSVIWHEVSHANFRPNEGIEKSGQLARDGGSICVSGRLEPGESVTYPVVITWYFPNVMAPDTGGLIGQPSGLKNSSVWHPFYATKWKDAGDVLEYVRQHYEELRDKTQAFHDDLFSSTLPTVVLDAVSANLSVIKSPTVLRHENGDIWGWEGCFCDKGCCPGSCTHVWNYAQSIPHLFPSLERTLRKREYGFSMDDAGHINFRLPFPNQAVSHDFHPAVDGQLGGILKVYREWIISGDNQWLEKLYPAVKRSMDYCISRWDPRKVGLIEEPHHVTYDIEFWGPEGLSCSFYVAALSVMAQLSERFGDNEDAGIYKDLATKGTQAMQSRLFNGEFYVQDIMFDKVDDKGFVNLLAKLENDPTEEAILLRAEGPKYQIGRGCLSDGVFGAWLAELCGINSPQDTVSIKKHLQSVYRYNFRSDLSEHANTQRPGYAIGAEAGLLLCSWPTGGKPTLPFIYSDEVWTGIEYQVASHMIAHEMIEEGLSLVRAVRSRYDGHVRNPWNEYECGSYYARAMASYALLLAYSGFSYNAVTQTLTIAPKSTDPEFNCFFSTATGWGMFRLNKDSLVIDLRHGTLVVENLHIITHEGSLQITPGITVTSETSELINLDTEYSSR